MHDILTNFSWLGVIVGVIFAFALGYFWYSPKVFGTAWAAGNGFEMDDTMPTNAMIVHLIGLFLVSWFVGVTAAADVLMAALLATGGFTLLLVASHMYSRRISVVRMVDAGYWLASLMVMVIAHAIL